jgi:MoxR-like ATPase
MSVPRAGAADGRGVSLEQVLYQVKRVIVGQDVLLERMVVALLARGHLLVEGVPGLAKTLAVKTFADALGVEFQRVQFTPDLVPADIVGTRIYNQKLGQFEVSLGPIFANLVLADEINRAPAKVQSALLEAMQERQVTIGRETHPLPDPFLVMATQNPIESDGTSGGSRGRSRRCLSTRHSSSTPYAWPRPPGSRRRSACTTWPVTSRTA